MLVSPKLVRIASLRTVAEFRAHVASLGIDLPVEDTVATGAASPLAQPIEAVRINGKRIGNRYATQPMEGWDASPTGNITPEVVRRWQRFGASGAKLIFGGEAMAVRPDGRANPHQLIIQAANKAGLASLREELLAAHKDLYGTTDDLVLGFQLTHSGRFSRPRDEFRLEPRAAYRHPILDRKCQVVSDAQIITDGEIERLVEDFIQAAALAWDVGADFVDIKHCHGYLLHELLGAFTREGRYGGSFENRTRALREIVSGIRASGNRIELGVRLSAFDFVPFRPDPEQSTPLRPGPGVPEDFSHCLPYHYGFGVNPDKPTTYDLTEAFRFVDLCSELGIKLLNVSAGSPYYNPHIQRPAAYPPSDGYQPPEDPLVGVARQIHAARQLKARAPRGLLLIGTAYSYLQEFLPQVAQYVLRHGWIDLVGLGRAVLAYPDMLPDALRSGKLSAKKICRTFSDCTTAPRNGLISGCYPLDDFYRTRAEASTLKRLKRPSRA